jgi:hypothetical protein
MELTSSARERIERLRAHALSANPPSVRSEEGEFYYLKGWLDSRRESHILRRATAASVMLDNMTPVIDPYELIVGKPCYRHLTDKELETKIPVVKGKFGYVLHSDHSIPHTVYYDTYRYFIEKGLELGRS